MVNPIVGQQAETTTTPELRVEWCVDYHVSLAGTRAQLEAEGVLPADVEWPRPYATSYWEAAGFAYSLRRLRPDGHKGAMRTWQEIDSWILLITVVDHDHFWHARRAIERKTEELRAEIHRHTPAWWSECEGMMRRIDAARHDLKFQAFKALVPGLIPPKRGRKPKAAP